ncbi:MAG: phenylalanine--tRNA ligase subunit beta [Planctomycetota bacterium]
MPTITVNIKDLQHLMGMAMDRRELEDRLRVAKAELDEYDETAGEARIELNDTNRPDLWCTEGLARQLRAHQTGKCCDYPFFNENPSDEDHLSGNLFIDVDVRLEKIRPFVAAFEVKGPPVTDAFLVQIIQTQEKLCENYGRKRRSVAIGIYNAAKIAFPVRYVAAGPEEYSFVPLGFDGPMTLKQILEEHPKGKEYGKWVQDSEWYPLLTDREGKVLSFPPIINSRETGEVVVGDSHLFVEATGLDMRQLVLVMNIMAANFADRGWEVTPVSIKLPYESEFGQEIQTPMNLNTRIDLALEDFSRTVGEECDPGEVVKTLGNYGVAASVENGRITASCPAYRDDYLHAMDVVEDFAISRGFHSFEPVMPSAFTVGKLKPLTVLVDRMRDQMVGLGFEELFSNLLTNRTVERDNMLLAEDPIVSVDNVMTDTYSVLRSSIIPSLLRVESKSSKALYPHKLFEAGEVCRWDPDAPSGSRTETRLAALWASADSGFSQIHAVLDVLLFYMVREYTLRPAEYPFYFEGRSGDVIRGGEVIGHIGEIHPEVLTRFNINMPCAAFELVLNCI